MPVAEVIRRVGILVQPVMPGSAAAILDQVAVPADRRRFADLGELLRPGVQLPAPKGVFPRYVEAGEGTA